MIISDEKKEQIKAAADIVEVISEYVTLKKNGMDYFGLCPFHSEKTPSFSVAQDKQIFYCFGCGATGDVFEFLVKKDGISFPDAVARVGERVGIELLQESGVRSQYSGGKTRNYKPETRNQEFTPDPAQSPGEIWQEKAGKLVMWAHDNLLNNSKRLAWLEERGIGIDLVKYSMLGWNPGENGKDLYRPRESWGLEPALKDDGTKKKLWIPVGLIIPLAEKIEDRTSDIEYRIKVERIRIRTERDNPKYYVLPGSGMRCMVFGAHASRAYVIVESELDGIMLYGIVRANKIGAVALGSASKKPELETYDILKKAPVILNALDYDAAGTKAIAWWEERFPDSHRRWPVPEGKDPGDAYKAGIDIAAWIRLGLPEAWNWKSRTSQIVHRTSEKPNMEKPDIADRTSYIGKTGTNGRSDLLDEIKSGGPQEGSPLKEFVALVKNSPVVISVSPGQLKIKDAPSWALSNPDKSGRISELVFLNKEVRSFLMGLGSVELNSRNINTVMGGR